MRSATDDITRALLRFGESIDGWKLIPALSTEAARLVYEDPFAFLLGASLDRGIPAEVAWTYPLWIHERFGHLDPARISAMSLEEIARVLAACPRRPRYARDAPRTVKEIAGIVMTAGRGDARNLWAGRRPAEIRHVLTQVHGIGDGIAAMVIALLVRVFHVRFDDADQGTMDVKADVHVVRVLTRLGLLRDGRTTNAGSSRCSDADLALEVTRSMHPDNPGLLDAPLWVIGRTWCEPAVPRCDACPVAPVCEKRPLPT